MSALSSTTSTSGASAAAASASSPLRVGRDGLAFSRRSTVRSQLGQCGARRAACGARRSIELRLHRGERVPAAPRCCLVAPARRHLLVRPRRPRRAAAPRASACRGPSPSLSAQTRPPCSSTSSFTSASPMPVPSYRRVPTRPPARSGRRSARADRRESRCPCRRPPRCDAAIRQRPATLDRDPPPALGELERVARAGSRRSSRARPDRVRSTGSVSSPRVSSATPLRSASGRAPATRSSTSAADAQRPPPHRELLRSRSSRGRAGC